MFANHLRIALGMIGVGVLALAIGNAETSAQIHMVDLMAVGAQLAHEIGEQGESVVEGFEIGDLRADMHVDASDAQARQGGGLLIDSAGARDRDAKLVLGFAGRNLVMGARVHIRVHADRDRRGDAFTLRDGRDGLQLGLGLNVEAQDLFIKPQRDFPRGLADP